MKLLGGQFGCARLASCWEEAIFVEYVEEEGFFAAVCVIVNDEVESAGDKEFFLEFLFEHISGGD